jgi:hypothetical protein
MKTLLKYRKDYFSQNGEDGIIEELLNRLDINTGWFVEFGVSDGKDLSNSFILVEKGWNGVEIERDINRFQNIENNLIKYNENIITLCKYVSVSRNDSLDSILSCDWQVWSNFNNYNPKIVIIEINNNIPPWIEQIDTEKEKTPYGSSFTFTLNLGRRKGYELICHTGNMIFVRKDLIQKLNLPKEEIENPESLFRDKWITKEGYPKLITYCHFYLKAKSKLYNFCYKKIVGF